MPANLTPQYQKAEIEYRRAQSAQERIDCLEQMLQLIPKHKGTEKLQADLKSRLKEARGELQQEKKAGKAGRSYRFPHQGAGQVILLGAPNSGKSRVLAELTHAHPEVADYPFCTREPLPGMMPWQDAFVQLIDTPPITDTHFEPYLSGIVRAADLVVLCFDGTSDDAPEQTLQVIEQLKQRKTELANETGFDEENFSIVKLKTLMVVTRADAPDVDERLELFREICPTSFETLPVELEREHSREELRNRIYELLGVIRVYTKRPGKPADKQEPFTIPLEGTVEDLALKVHRELAESLKFARVWGANVVDGQTVGREHQLCDGDVVELH